MRLKILLNHRIISHISQIGDRLRNITSSSVRLFQQHADIFHHPLGLFYDIARIDNLSPVIDTRRTRDEDLFTIPIRNSRTPLEGYSIFISRIQVRGSVKELNLSRLQPIHRITVHLYQHRGIGMTSLDTRTSDIMRLLRKILRDKNFFPGFHHTGVIHVYVLYKEPSTDTMRSQRTTLPHQLHHIVIQ